MKNLVKVLSLVLVCAFALLFTGCAPKDGEKAKEKMEKAGYTVVLINGQEDSEIVCNITCTKGLFEVGLNGTLYVDNATAKEAYEKLLDGAEKDISVQKIGKWVVYGSEEAVKDFK